MERYRYIDMSKGFAMLLVILGHVPTVPIELKKIIYSFHIPIFFFISGYLYNDVKYNSFTIAQFIKSRIKKYIIPYFTIGFICYFLFGVIYPLLINSFNMDYVKNLFKYLLGLIYSFGSPSFMVWSAPLWFLTCIFVAELILFTVLKKYKKPCIIFLIIGSVGYLYSIFIGFKLPWNIDVALIAVCFMYIGNVCRKNNIFENSKPQKYSIILIALFAASVIFNSQIDFNRRDFANIILTFISGVSASLLLITIMKSIKQNKVLEFFGSNSLLMMGFTYSVLNFVMISEKNFKFLDNYILHFIIQVIILSVLVMAILKVKLMFNTKKEELNILQTKAKIF